MKSKEDLFEYLRGLQINTKTYDYNPDWTADEQKKFVPGCDCKNLFLKDKKGGFWLVIVKFETKIDLKSLAKKLSVGSMRFGKQEDLTATLGVLSVGGVTPFGLINDADNRVSVLVEANLFECELLTFHPLDSNALTAISGADFKKFLSSCGNRVETLSF